MSTNCVNIKIAHRRCDTEEMIRSDVGLHLGGLVMAGHNFLWYNGRTLNDLPPNSTLPKCNQCGGVLIVLNKKTEKNGSSFSAVTTTTYRCSNKECQEEIDRKVNERLRLREERELARQNRLKLTPLNQVQE